MSNDNIEDKLILARRGALRDPERRRLDMALNTSDSARSLYEAGLAFDRMQTERASDRELLTRVTARTCARTVVGQARQGRKRSKLLWLTAAALLASGAAAASLWHFERPTRTHSTGALVARPPSNRAPRTGGPAQERPANDEATDGSSSPQRASPEQTRARDLTDASTHDADESSLEATSPAPAVAAQPDVTAGKTASALFKQANDARKAGDPTRALALYQKLRQRFPASAEAQVSLVQSGRLLLASGQASRALSHFEQYLAAGARGGLAEEALSGKAHAFAELGRHREERAVWQTLLRQFPNSVYVRKARERLR